LRPRRLREAAAIWRGLTDARGVIGRDAVWAHPDLMPTADDFDDPESFVRGRPALDISDIESMTGREAGEPGGGTKEGRDTEEGPGAGEEEPPAGDERP
jgi:hypothetical protein